MEEYKDYNKIVLISGGGTGGHLFPAIAIANEIKRRYPSIEVVFVGAEGKIEATKVPENGFKVELLKIQGLQRSLSKENLKLPFVLINSFIKANKIINKYNPVAVVGVGGYASAPLLLMAGLKNIPILIQEQNSYAGITNKILSQFADKICVAYPNMHQFFDKTKIKLTGNPLRNNILKINTSTSHIGYQKFNLNPNLKTILVVGGSLGALTINESIRNSLELIIESNVQLIWQTGQSYFEKAKESALKFKSKNIVVQPFIQEIDLAYSVANIVISRAGAMSISELSFLGKACIFIPSPNVAEDHQTKNAIALVNENAALLIKDIEARTLLPIKIKELINNEQLIITLEKNIQTFAKGNATNLIVNELETLMI